MALPRVPLPEAEVDVAGTPVKIRGISRAEAVALSKQTDDLDALEVALVALATGETEDAVVEWRATVPYDVAGVLVDAVMELSGLDELGKGSNGP